MISQAFVVSLHEGRAPAAVENRADLLPDEPERISQPFAAVAPPRGTVPVPACPKVPQ
jgi:hypothetical protein